MTRNMLQIGDLDTNDQVAAATPSWDEMRAARREQTERRLGYAFLAVVAALGLSVLAATADGLTLIAPTQAAAPVERDAGLFNPSMSHLFDVSGGVRRL